MVDSVFTRTARRYSALEDVGDATKKLAAGEGSGIAAVVPMTAVSIQKRSEPTRWLCGRLLTPASSYASRVAVLAGLRAGRRHHGGSAKE